jgi:hypothetical protein
MFFNKKKEILHVPHVLPHSETVVIDEVIELTNTEIVEEIHDKFERAADELLEEAKRILKDQSSLDRNRMKMLASLGFTSTKDYVDNTQHLARIILSEEQIEFINYYKQNYPLNKFITENQVQSICGKYGLLCGDVNLFKGIVPNKNLKEIAAFKLVGKDKEIVYYRYDNGRKYLDNHKTFDKFNEKNKETLLSGGEVFGECGTRYGLLEGKFSICAPIADMDIRGMRVEEGYRIVKDDPIVLQPVPGGYLIVSKWGLEASDPSVINEINN